MPNNRIYWAVQGVSIAPHGSVAFDTSSGGMDTAVVHGVQTIGITTSFNLEQVFEIGQLSIYENIEDIPEVEVTMEKVIDGYPLIYHLATQGRTSTTLAGRSNQRCNVLLNIYGDTQDAASGTPQTEVLMSGMYVSSVSYTCPVDGNCTESVTLVGSNKEWRSSNFLLSTDMFDGTDSPWSASGVMRRQNVVFGADSYVGKTATLLPTEIEGISSSGTNDLVADVYQAHVQTLTSSVDFGRDQLNELGRRGPYFRFITYPTEVTTEIETTSSQGDQIDAVETSESNLTDQTILIVLEDSTKIDLGQSNKLSSVAYGGADATGGNATTTYTYTTFNDFTVTHDNDPG
jgi:hypothetical protein